MAGPIRRALRTCLVLIATATGAIPALAAAFDVPAGRVTQVVAVFAFAATIITGVLNHAEDNTRFPAILKAPASGGANPVPDPGPARDDHGRFVKQDGVIDLGTALVVIVVLVLVFVVLFGAPHYR